MKTLFFQYWYGEIRIKGIPIERLTENPVISGPRGDTAVLTVSEQKPPITVFDWIDRTAESLGHDKTSFVTEADVEVFPDTGRTTIVRLSAPTRDEDKLFLLVDAGQTGSTVSREGDPIKVFYNGGRSIWKLASGDAVVITEENRELRSEMAFMLSWDGKDYHYTPEP